MVRARSGGAHTAQQMQVLQDAHWNDLASRQRSGAQLQARVFSVFCMGSGASLRNQDDSLNSILALYNSCSTPKFLNEGVGSGNPGDWEINAITGNGMNLQVTRTLEAIHRLTAKPHLVLMTGHSRGAILCHMVAYAMAEDPELRDIPVKMIVLDPVHQSFGHQGADEFHASGNVESYHAILMENDNAKVLKLFQLFPFKFVQATDQQQKRMHYIPLPGSHLSGLGRDPVGVASKYLIAAYMLARGARFDDADCPLFMPTAIGMCECFAQILLQRQGAQGDFTKVSSRKRAVATARHHNQQARGNVQLPPITQPMFKFGYFLNEEHAYYFKQAFPYFFEVLSNAPNVVARNLQRFDLDYDKMEATPGALRDTFRSMLMEDLDKLAKDIS